MTEVVAPPATEFEARLPCPVCIGVQMEKLRMVGARSALVLDHCTRCGGVWFEKGEARQLTAHSPSDLWKHIPPRTTAPKPPCHGCFAPLDRDAARCDICGKRNELSCLNCARVMERRQHGGFTLDVCATCKGVWFDAVELKNIWSITVTEVDRKRVGRGGQALAIGSDVLLESLFWAPHLTIHAGMAATQGLSHVAGALGSVSAEGAANAAMGAAEVVGSAAEGLFETIMEIISSIFDG